MSGLETANVATDLLYKMLQCIDYFYEVYTRLRSPRTGQHLSVSTHVCPTNRSLTSCSREDTEIYELA